MEVAVVDACGGVFGHQRGSVHIFEIEDEEVWEDARAYGVPPEETLARLKEMRENGTAELTEVVSPDDVVTV